jgi:hypothetical protein
LSGDSFCTEFFSDKTAEISTLPSGSALVAAGLTVQMLFIASIISSALVFSRFIATACCCDREQYTGNGRAPASRRWLRTAFGVVALHIASAVLCGYALHLYAGAAASFLAAQPPMAQKATGLVGPVTGWTLMGGWSCGASAAAFHAIAAFIWAASYCKGRGKAAEAAAQAMDGYYYAPLS